MSAISSILDLGSTLEQQVDRKGAGEVFARCAAFGGFGRRVTWRVIMSV